MPGTIQEHRFVAHPWHNDGFTAFNYATRNAFANVVAGLFPSRTEAVRRRNDDIACRHFQQGHHTRSHALLVVENL
jgi:hypothetical protein